MKKCGFFDCNNPAKKGVNYCLSCENREENEICSACRQKQKPVGNQFRVFFIDSFSRLEKKYETFSKLRNKVPTRFQAQIDQALPQIKLSQKEERMVDKLKKLISDFVAEKGGKQDNFFYWRFCSDCGSEFKQKMKTFSEQNPQLKSIEKKLESKILNSIFAQISQEVGEENLINITDEIEAEIFNQLKENERKPDNKNQEEINRLQQELNSLRQQISDLRNSPNPPPPNSDDLQRIKDEIKNREQEINRLKNNSLSSQPSGDNPNLPLYLILGVVGIVIVSFSLFLVFSKKKKKNEFKYSLKNIKYVYHK